MNNPAVFTISLFGHEFSLYWYGVILMSAVMAAAWLAEREAKWRSSKPDVVWDILIWVLPAGVIGARIWYVVNAILGGSSFFLDKPQEIFNLREGGLHFFGAIVFGAAAAFIYARRYKVDLWRLLDAAAPALLIGQALARPANFINQELYGQPTTLPWGISIDALHRIPPYNDLAIYPLGTRFHPTFAYEMIWNFAAAALLLWASRRFKKQLKPGMLFAAWSALAGTGRFIIEFFRPDQPQLWGSWLTTSQAIAALMAFFGIVWLLARCQIFKLPILSDGPNSYQP